MSSPAKSNVKSKIKNRLLSRGCRNILLALLDKDRKWSELEKIEDKRTVSECLDLLISLGFVEPVIDYNESPKGRKKYRLTDRGTNFAELLKRVDNNIEAVLKDFYKS